MSQNSSGKKKYNFILFNRKSVTRKKIGNNQWWKFDVTLGVHGIPWGLKRTKSTIIFTVELNRFSFLFPRTRKQTCSRMPLTIPTWFLNLLSLYSSQVIYFHFIIRWPFEKFFFTLDFSPFPLLSANNTYSPFPN